MAKERTKSQVIQRVQEQFHEWAEKYGTRYGRGYYFSGNVVTYGDGHVDGFHFLQRATEPRGEYDRKMELLDDLLVSIPADWEPEHRALLAGSIIRYMAELD